VKKLTLPAIALAGLLVSGVTPPAQAVDIAGILETGTIATQIDSAMWYLPGIPDPITEATPNWGGQTQATDTFQFNQLPERSEMLVVTYHVDTSYTMYTIPGPDPDVWYDLPAPGGGAGSRVMFKDTLFPGISIERTISVLAGASTAPDPFTGTTCIRWNLRADGPVEVSVFDGTGRRVLGRAVASAVGSRSFVWDGRDDAGQRLAPGVYFVQVRSGVEQATVRTTLTR